MADEEQQQQPQPDSGREGVEAGGGGVAGDPPGYNGSRSARAPARAPPSPVWLRDGEEDDAPLQRVERTPLNVISWDLDDPFPREGGGDGNEEEHGRDDHDSEGSDDVNNVVALPEAVEPGMAAIYLGDLLETYRRYRLRELTVSFGKDEVVDPSFLPDDFRRFVDSLEEYHRIKTLHLTRANFGSDPELRGAGEDARGVGGDDGWEEELDFDLSQRVEERCLDDFFGLVLCSHLSLREITISKSRIPTKYWRLYTENFPVSGYALCQLSLESTPLTAEGCQLLKRMLQRKVWLFQLSLADCGLGAEEWRTVCEGIAEGSGETHTVTLTEDGVVVGPDTLLPLLRAPSGVVDLRVGASDWSDGAFEGFVTGLRTNERLCSVSISSGNDIPRLDLVEELLTTYNCTLETFWLNTWGDSSSRAWVDGLLERNKRVRSLGLPDSDTAKKRYGLTRKTAFGSYHLPRKSLWPRVLEAYGRLPTQLYRFLREGNLEDFASQVEAAAPAAAPAALDRPRGKKKRRLRGLIPEAAAEAAPVRRLRETKDRRCKNTST